VLSWFGSRILRTIGVVKSTRVVEKLLAIYTQRFSTQTGDTEIMKGTVNKLRDKCAQLNQKT